MTSRLELDKTQLKQLLKYVADNNASALRNITNLTMRRTRSDMVEIVAKEINLPTQGSSSDSGGRSPGLSGLIRKHNIKPGATVGEIIGVIDVSERAISTIHFSKDKSISTGGKRRPIRASVYKGSSSSVGRRLIAQGKSQRGGSSGAKLILYRSKSSKTFRLVRTAQGPRVQKKETLRKAVTPSLHKLLDKGGIGNEVLRAMDENLMHAIEKEMSKQLSRGEG